MKTTKSIFILLFLLQNFFSLAQKTQQLLQEFEQSSGLLKISKAIQLSDQYLLEGNFKAADQFAQRAFDNASQLQETELKAMALNRKAKATEKMEKKGLFGKEKAIPIYKQSIALLSDNKNQALILDNLEGLKRIYQKNNNEKEIVAIENRINRILGNPTVQKSANSDNKKQLQAEMLALQQQNQNLQQQNAAATSEQIKLLKESQTLSKTLISKEEAIAQMSEAQLKNEVLLMQRNLVVDSLSNYAQLSKMELQNKEIALKEEKATRNLYLALGAIVLLLAIASLIGFLRQRFFNRLLEEKNKIIKDEKERSDNLLLNILPSLVANELKTKGFTEARHFDNVTVLFTDFVNFSQITEKLTPQELVSELDFCFKAFDDIVQKYGLEKIKTIGDAYMCAGGLPEPSATNALDVVNAAIEMRNFIHHWNMERNSKNKPEFRARFGIHNGSVVAGVVGNKKFAFDIWGDTVNIAARMESGSIADKINISGSTYALVKEKFKCEYRGKIPAKNKGEIDMYFVD